MFKEQDRDCSSNPAITFKVKWYLCMQREYLGKSATLFTSTGNQAGNCCAQADQSIVQKSTTKQANASSSWIPAGCRSADGVHNFAVSHRWVSSQPPAGKCRSCSSQLEEDNSLVSAYIFSLILAKSLRRHVIHLPLQCNYRGITTQ